MSEIGERIKQIIDGRKDSLRAFASQVGIDNSNLGKKIAGTLPITKADIYKISQAVGVNANWLINGEGEVYTEEGKQMLARQFTTALSKNTIKTEKAVPFYDVEFALGYDEMYNDTPNVPTKCITIPGYDKADFWCRASGDSMKPIINNGDIIALKAIEDWQSFLPMNEVYAVMTTNDLRTVKVVRRGSDDMHLTLHAYNEEYEDQEIPKASITKVFRVLGSLKAF